MSGRAHIHLTTENIKIAKTHESLEKKLDAFVSIQNDLCDINY